MSLIFAEGFGMNLGATQLGRKFTTASGTVDTRVTGYKDHGYALSSTNATLRTPDFTQQNTWVLGCALWWATRTASVGSKIEFLLAGAAQLTFEVVFDEDGNTFTIDVKRGSTTLDTVGPFFAREPAYYEFKATVRTLTNGSWEIKRDGVSAGSGSATNTADQGSDGCDGFKVTFDSPGATMRFVDLYIVDDQGAIRNDYLGPTKVLSLRPSADGADSDWAPSSGSDHYALVDDPANNPSDTTRVTSFTANDIDLYAYEDLDLPSGITVLGVVVESVVSMEASGSRTLRAKYRNAGDTRSNGSNETVSTTAWQWIAQIWEQDPIAASDWTKALVDAAQFGIEVVS